MFTMFAVYQERGGDRIQCTFTEPSLDQCRFEVDDVLWESCGWLTLVWSGTLEQAHQEALDEWHCIVCGNSCPAWSDYCRECP